MGVVLNKIQKIRELPVTVVNDNTTNNDLYVLFSETGVGKDIKISNTKLKFNPSSGDLTTGGGLSAGGGLTAGGAISGTDISGDSLAVTGDLSSGAITSSGNISGVKVYGAVYNDIADFIEVPDDFVFEYGRAYTRDRKYNVKESSKYAEKGIIGIASDTYGFALGEKPGKNQIPIAVGGWVLAYVDKKYHPGTALTTGKDGNLTKIKDKDVRRFPERIIATYDRPEREEVWNKIVVNNRHWVKVK